MIALLGEVRRYLMEELLEVESPPKEEYEVISKKIDEINRKLIMAQRTDKG